MSRSCKFVYSNILDSHIGDGKINSSEYDPKDVVRTLFEGVTVDEV